MEELQAVEKDVNVYGHALSKQSDTDYSDMYGVVGVVCHAPTRFRV